jgi:DNA-binding MarR family transcriptional regulator
LSVPELLDIASRNWSYLERLYSGETHVTDLAGHSGKSLPETSLRLKELTKAQLTHHRRKEGDKHVYYYLTPEGKRVIDTLKGLQGRSPSIPAHYADSKELGFLFEVIEKPASKEALQGAEGLLLQIARNASMSDIRHVLSLAERFLSGSESSARWPLWLKCVFDLTVFLKSHSRTPMPEELAALGQISKRILPEARRMIEDKKTQAGTREVAIRLAREIQGEEEWYAYVKRSIETGAKEMPSSDDVSWAALTNAHFDTLKEMYSSRRMDTWKWLFNLMQSQDETIRKRAQGLLESLK